MSTILSRLDEAASLVTQGILAQASAMSMATYRLVYTDDDTFDAMCEYLDVAVTPYQGYCAVHPWKALSGLMYFDSELYKALMEGMTAGVDALMKDYESETLHLVEAK